MSVSVVDICNFGLANLGEEGTITSLTEDSKAARLCNLRFNSIRDFVLRDHPWNCAIKQLQLAQISSTPVFGYNYQYQLPVECLRVLRVDEDNEEKWRIIGRTLHTDLSTVKAEYIYRVEDTNEFDAQLIEAIAARLSMLLAIPITDSESRLKSMSNLYKSILVSARGVDGQETGNQDELIATTWLNSRL